MNISFSLWEFYHTNYANYTRKKNYTVKTVLVALYEQASIFTLLPFTCDTCNSWTLQSCSNWYVSCLLILGKENMRSTGNFTVDRRKFCSGVSWDNTVLACGIPSTHGVKLRPNAGNFFMLRRKKAFHETPISGLVYDNLPDVMVTYP